MHLHHSLRVIVIVSGILCPANRGVSSFLLPLPLSHKQPSLSRRRQHNLPTIIAADKYFIPSTLRRILADGVCFPLAIGYNSDDDDETLAESRLRSSELCINYENNDSPNVSSSFVFETTSRIVQHYLYPSDGDTSSETWTSRSLLCRIIDDDDADDNDVTTNSSNYWAEMFAPLYGSTISLPTAQLLDNEHRMQHRQQRKRHRINLKLTVAYRGKDFCGWEDQRHSIIPNDAENSPQHHLPLVQGMLADILDPILGNDQQHHRNGTTMQIRKPIKIKVAGRTDAGVSAIGQICRVRTYRQPTLTGGQSIEQFVKDYVNEHVPSSIEKNAHGAKKSPPSLRVRNVECVDDTFHPTFGASCRAYAYLIDVDILNGTSSRTYSWKYENEDDRDMCNDFTSVRSTRMSTTKLVHRLNTLLCALEGKELDYIALSYGKVKSETTLCTLHHARAHLVELPPSNNDASQKPQRAICIELVGDRFLRRMVRILVATAMREAYRGDVALNAEEGEEEGDDCLLFDNALLNIILSEDRVQRAKAAPPDGLIFVGAAYDGE